LLSIQYGFQQGKSKLDILIHLVTDIWRGYRSRQLSEAAFLDISVDDIILYMTGTTQQDIIPQLQKGLNDLRQTLLVHEMGLHIHQTKITNMIFL
jgi:hypothetical protein